MKNFLKKLTVVGIIVVIFLCLVAFDYIRAQDIEIELISITPETVVADPDQSVMLTLKVTKRGKPAAGDDISGLVKGQGNLSSDKVRVGEDGIVVFEYFPYNYIPGVFEESDETIVFRDISDSVFIAIQKKVSFSFHVDVPDGSSNGMKMNDLFGD